MPKSQIVEPAKERKAGTVPFAEVPLNQYKSDLSKEVETYGADALLGIYHDMLLIREFENMLQSIKTQGSYEGIEYDHKGPAHLSIGQEASAVGRGLSTWSGRSYSRFAPFSWRDSGEGDVRNSKAG